MFSLQSGAYEHESCACSRDPGEKCGLESLLWMPAGQKHSIRNFWPVVQSQNIIENRLDQPVIFGGDTASTWVVKPEVHAEVR